MMTLKNKLQAAGFKTSAQIRQERDRAIRRAMTATSPSERQQASRQAQRASEELRKGR